MGVLTKGALMGCKEDWVEKCLVLWQMKGGGGQKMREESKSLGIFATGRLRVPEASGSKEGVPPWIGVERGHSRGALCQQVLYKPPGFSWAFLLSAPKTPSPSSTGAWFLLPSPLSYKVINSILVYPFIQPQERSLRPYNLSLPFHSFIYFIIYSYHIFNQNL